MPVPARFEHFIPLRRSDLMELLCRSPNLTTEAITGFRRFCRLLEASFHYQYNQRLDELKHAYSPFDPDSDARDLIKLSSEEKQDRLNELFSDFAWLLERANFKHLNCHELEQSLRESSAWGIHMDVDFSVFERIAVFVRGDMLQKRTQRPWRKLFRTQQMLVPVYQRLVLILKMRPHHRLDDLVSTDCVYLKVFKDIPKLDVKMLLPSARVRLTKLDRSKIGLPLLSGLAMAAWNILKDIGETFEKIFLSTGTMTAALWTLALGGIGYGYRSYYGYQQTKQRYRLTLTQSLYFQNLDNNAGVLYRLFDEAEEQECREAFLAYYFLWRNGERGMTGRELEQAVEQYLREVAGIEVDFKLTDALARLEKVHVVERVNDHFLAAPLPRALEQLERCWGDYAKSVDEKLNWPNRVKETLRT